jgi:transposase
LRHDRIDAPWLLDGPIDGETFAIYVERVLCPTLHPGDIVVMDNLGSHEDGRGRRLIRATGAKLFLLPKYSPDLNPIEQLFAKLKHFLRRPPPVPTRPSVRQSAISSAASQPWMRHLLRELRLCSILTTSPSSCEISGRCPFGPGWRPRRCREFLAKSLSGPLVRFQDPSPKRPSWRRAAPTPCRQKHDTFMSNLVVHYIPTTLIAYGR